MEGKGGSWQVSALKATLQLPRRQRLVQGAGCKVLGAGLHPEGRWRLWVQLMHPESSPSSRAGAEDKMMQNRGLQTEGE